MSEEDGGREARSSLGDTPYLAPEDRKLLELGKAEHRETTATARRALQVTIRGDRRAVTPAAAPLPAAKRQPPSLA